VLAPPANSLVRWRIELSCTALTVEPAGTPSCSQVRSIDQTLIALRSDPAIRASSAPAVGAPSEARQIKVEDAPAVEIHPSPPAVKSNVVAEVAPSTDPTASSPWSITAATSSAARLLAVSITSLLASAPSDESTEERLLAPTYS
jgi:hypothetical protein